MRNNKTHSMRNLPPCPDPDKYILIQTKEGNFWRRKRNTIKKAAINDSLRLHAASSKITMPAAKRILDKLEPFTRSLSMGRITVAIGSRLKKTLHTTGQLKFSALQGLEFQEEYPLRNLLPCDSTIWQEDGEVGIKIDIHKGEMEPKGTLATDYYFELILLYGDPDKERGLKIRSVESSLYSFDKKVKAACELELPLPTATKQWMLLLKVNCMEGNEIALHPKHYAMKIIKAGAE